MNRKNTFAERRDAALAAHRDGRLDTAEASYRAILAESPGDLETLHLLGVLLGQSGKDQAALEFLRRTIDLAPDVARYQANLGTALLRLARCDEALAAFQRACELDPGQAGLHADRGTALAELDRFPEAVEAFRRSLQLDPAEFGAWINLGRALQARGAHSEALHCFERAIELEPDSAVAHTNHGCALAELDRLPAAIESHRRAVGCDPQLIDARLNLAAALHADGRSESAIEVYRQVLALEPGQPEACRGLAGVYHAMGDYPRATAALEHAILSDPENIDALCNLGQLRLESGNLGAAEQYYRRALSINPAHTAAWTGLTETRVFSADDPELASLAGLLNDTSPDRDAHMRIAFAYAKACDDAGDLDAAGSALILANSLARAGSDYEVSKDEVRMQRIETVIDSALLERWRDAATSSGRPIFIVGMPRSGTTLFDQMLACHPSVHGAGEIPDFQRLVLEMAPGGYPQNLAGVDPERLRQLAGDYLLVLDRINHDADRVSDKLTANFLYVGIIAAIFPQAAILHCERDALDTCWSCFRKPFAGSQPWSYDLSDIARFYRAYHRLMKHWERLLPGRIHCIRYEHLVSSPERALRAALDYCGLRWHPQCLQYFRNPRAVRTASAAQVRRPLYANAIGGSRRYGELLAPLKAELGELFDDSLPAPDPSRTASHR